MKPWDMVSIKFGTCRHRWFYIGLGYTCLMEGAVYLSRDAAEVVEAIINHECIHSVIFKIFNSPIIGHKFDNLFERKPLPLNSLKEIRKFVLTVVEENGMPRR